MKAKVLDFHDCKKPNLPTREVELSRTARRWWGKRYTETWVEREYVYKGVKWTCECGAKWSFNASIGSAGTGNGFWICDYRPEVWKEVEL